MGQSVSENDGRWSPGALAAAGLRSLARIVAAFLLASIGVAAVFAFIYVVLYVGYSVP